jgi:hypothetical protein
VREWRLIAAIRHWKEEPVKILRASALLIGLVWVGAASADPGLKIKQDGESASVNMCDATFTRCIAVAVQRFVDAADGVTKTRLSYAVQDFSRPGTACCQEGAGFIPGGAFSVISTNSASLDIATTGLAGFTHCCGTFAGARVAVVWTADGRTQLTTSHLSKGIVDGVKVDVDSIETMASATAIGSIGSATFDTLHAPAVFTSADIRSFRGKRFEH